jgi:hypothetical protein
MTDGSNTKDRFTERTAICRDFWFVRRRNSDSLFTKKFRLEIADQN